MKVGNLYQIKFERYISMVDGKSLDINEFIETLDEDGFYSFDKPILCILLMMKEIEKSERVMPGRLLVFFSYSHGIFTAFLHNTTTFESVFTSLEN